MRTEFLAGILRAEKVKAGMILRVRVLCVFQTHQLSRVPPFADVFLLGVAVGLFCRVIGKKGL